MFVFSKSLEKTKLVSSGNEPWASVFFTVKNRPL